MRKYYVGIAVVNIALAIVSLLFFPWLFNVMEGILRDTYGFT